MNSVEKAVFDTHVRDIRGGTKRGAPSKAVRTEAVRRWWHNTRPTLQGIYDMISYLRRHANRDRADRFAVRMKVIPPNASPTAYLHNQPSRTTMPASPVLGSPSPCANQTPSDTNNWSDGLCDERRISPSRQLEAVFDAAGNITPNRRHVLSFLIRPWFASLKGNRPARTTRNPNPTYTVPESPQNGSPPPTCKSNDRHHTSNDFEGPGPNAPAF